VRRISVTGGSGSGKTTLGRALAKRLGVPFIELDSIFHQPDWQPLPVEEFRSRVAAAAANDGWVIDGNYSKVRDLVWARADTVIWFDLPRSTVMRQVITRTLRRAITRQELWNGNRERPLSLLRLDPNKSIIRWAWTSHGRQTERCALAATDPTNAHLNFIRITSRQDIDQLLQSPVTTPDTR
jgi:adenylate kinase family enzyme